MQNQNWKFWKQKIKQKKHKNEDETRKNEKEGKMIKTKETKEESWSEK